MHKHIPLPKRKSPLKKLFRFLLIVFVLMNIIAAMHAWSFTHFSENTGARVDASKLGGLQKAKFILFGASLPRPVNTDVPSQPHENITIQSNVPLSAWYIKAEKPKGTILLFHGYQGTKSALIKVSDEFLKLGYNTLLVDFMGSGRSEGNKTTIGYDEAQNVKSCFDYVTQQGEKNIYLYGSSMGAVSIMKAINDGGVNPKAIIIGCPFGTMYKTVCARFNIMGIPKFPLAGMLTFWGGVENGFWAFGHNPEEYAKSIKCPTLLLWGEQDNRVSGEEIDAIYANLAGQKELRTYVHSGHGQYVDTEHDEWVSDVSGFLRTFGN